MPDTAQIQNNFHASLAVIRNKRIASLLGNSKEITKLLNRLSIDLAAMISDAPEFSARWYRRMATQAQLNEIIAAYTSGYRTSLMLNMQRVIGETVGTWEMATAGAMAGAGITLAKSFDHIPIGAMQEMLFRPGTDGLTLSNRIWNLGRVSKIQIQRILLSSITTGQSAKDTARLLRNFATSPLSLADRQDLRLLRGRMRKLGSSLRYRSERLARTEIANAYHEAQRRSAVTSPVIRGLKWNLSAAHPETDICDTLASADDYGLGAGVYPPHALPFLPHPHDLCFITSVLRPINQWGKPKPIYKRRNVTKGIIMRRVSKSTVAKKVATAADDTTGA